MLILQEKDWNNYTRKTNEFNCYYLSGNGVYDFIRYLLIVWTTI